MKRSLSNRRASIGGKINDKDMAKYFADRNKNLDPRAASALDNDSSNDAYDSELTPSPRVGMMSEQSDYNYKLDVPLEAPPQNVRMLSAPVRQARQKTLSTGWGANQFSDETLVKPMKITSFMVDHPFVVHILVLALSVVVTIINPQEYILSDVVAISAILPDYEYFTDGYHANIGIIERLKGNRTKGNPQSGQDMTYVLMFELASCDLEEHADCDLEKNPWILTPSNLETIIKWEDRVQNDAHGKWSDLCFHPLEVHDFSVESDATSTCTAAVGSAAKTLADMLGGDFDAMTTDQIKATVKTFVGIVGPAVTGLFDPLILEGLDSENVTDMKALRYRSIFTFGFPYPTNVEAITEEMEAVVNNATTTETVTLGFKKSSSYSDFYDDLRNQRMDHLYKDYIWDLYHDIDYVENGNLVDGNLRINSFGQELWGDFFQWYNTVVIVPLYIIAATVTLLYATYDIGSFFLSFMALWEVAVTLPFTWFWYNYVFGIKEFVHIQFAVIFLLFAVGVYYYPAYVFVDHWLHTMHIVEDKEDWKTRMSIAWKQAAAGAGVAQSTTFVSFMSAAIGTILMFKAFGVFAAIAISTNYVLGIMLFPCSIIIWELYIRKWEQALALWMHEHGLGFMAFQIQEGFYKRFQTESQSRLSISSKKSPLHGADGEEVDWFKESMKRLKSGIVDIGYGDQDIEELVVQYRRNGVMVGIKWMHILHRTWVKVTVLLVTFAWLSVSLWGCSKIQLLEENEDFIGAENFLMKSMTKAVGNYAPLLNPITVAFGIKGLKAKSRSVWQSDSVGEAELVPLSVHTAEQQEWLISYCDLIRDYVPDANPSDKLVSSDDAVDCLFEDFRDWVLTESDVSNGTWPLLKEGDVSDLEQKAYFLGYFHEWYHFSAHGVDKRNGYKVEILHDPKNEEEPYELKAFFVGVESTYPFWSPQPLADKEEANWREFMSASTTACYAALPDDHGNLCSPRVSSLRMAWSEGYKGYWESAVSSVYTAFPIIFVILMIVLNNWIIAGMCCLNVFCIMTSVLGIIGFIGWQFGLTECASVVLVIGFSVDYCVHIAHGYIVAPLKDNREHRCQFALLQNGHAIISSAFVSVLSTIPILIDNQQVLFFKMGVLTTLTVCFSVIFSFTFFTLMLATIAPEGNAGKLFGRNNMAEVQPMVEEGRQQHGFRVEKQIVKAEDETKFTVR